MKKAILLILLAMIFVFAMFGCEKPNDPSKDEPPASSTEGLVPATPIKNGGQFEIR